jgi:phospholipase C
VIINFDEHGGFADHVAPPTNIPAPEDGLTFSGVSDEHNVTYDFTRLGIRVPAFIISPWIPPNTLVGPGTSYADNSAYTHTSFLHFLQNLWGLEGLNNRVQWAMTFEQVFSDTPQANALESLPQPVWYVHSASFLVELHDEQSPRTATDNIGRYGGSNKPEPEGFYLLNQDASYYINLPLSAGAA